MRQQRGKAQGEPESSRRTGRGEGRTGERKLTSEEASSQMVAASDGFDGDAGSNNRSPTTPAVTRAPLPSRARTPRPRSTGSTHPDRISLVRNAAIPLWSGRRSSRPDDLRKGGLTPQRGHEGPRSERRLPKGAGNP